MKTIRKISIFVGCIGLALAAGACGNLAEVDEARGQVEIPRGGKADGPLSCEGICGQKAPGGCWCDEKCATYGDCCADKKQECDGGSGGGSCAGHCGGQSPDGCYCDAACEGYGDCCADKPQVCPAGCTQNDDCAEGEFCAFKEGECLLPTFAILTGECKQLPTACPRVYMPVCGCDQKTYGNECNARAAGVSVAKQGACPPKKCGPFPGGNCPDGQTCNIESCGLGASGECVDKVDACPEIYGPVCGCDGKTYDNDCFRVAAGAAKDHDGVCQGDCFGAWLDQFGNCRGPADGVLPDQCCAEEKQQKCTAINQKYGQAVKDGKKCVPWPTFAPQCTHAVASSLINCSATCSTYINASPSGLSTFIAEWNQLGCDTVPWICAAYICPEPTGGNCDVSGGLDSTCEDVF